MNIQIFGKSKCFDTKKAERYFKERRIRYQFIDIIKYGMSRGELKSVCGALGVEALANPEDRDYPLFQYLASDEAKMEKLYEIPERVLSGSVGKLEIKLKKVPERHNYSLTSKRNSGNIP